MPYPFQIFQSDKAIFFAYEYDGAVRNIFLKDPGPAPADSWMGQSVGHWEGDTLVIDVTGLDERTWFDRAGDYHSDALHVVERYTRTGPETMLLRGHHRGSQGVFAALEDPHAALPSRGKECAPDGIQMRGVRGRPDVWRIQQETGKMNSYE